MGLLLAFAPAVSAQEPPPDALERIAANGSRFQAERERYTYRQSFDFLEYDKRGGRAGDYSEVRDIDFTPDGERTETFVKGPFNRLKSIGMTDEDFDDMRDMQPFVLTNDTLWRYDARYQGIESIEGRPCFVYRISPKQILEGQRMLDGRLWVDQESLQVVRAAGQPVPQHHSTSGSNLFAAFTTDYAPIDGEFWFPVKTSADDYLPFSTGVIHVSYEILFESYRRFSAESMISFGEPESK